MIKYHTITIDDYLVPEGSDLPDSIEVEIYAAVTYLKPDPEVGFEGGYNVGSIQWKSFIPINMFEIVYNYISKNEDRLKEILAKK